MKHPRITHRTPSAAAYCSRGTQYGLAFIAVPDLLRDQNDEGDFIPTTQLNAIYPSPESWIAHQLLRRCGYSGMLRNRD